MNHMESQRFPSGFFGSLDQISIHLETSGRLEGAEDFRAQKNPDRNAFSKTLHDFRKRVHRKLIFIGGKREKGHVGLRKKRVGESLEVIMIKFGYFVQ